MPLKTGFRLDICVLTGWLLALGFGSALAAPSTEDCGWLVQKGEQLVQQPDPTLKPLQPGPLPVPPDRTKAAYCKRDSIVTQIGDERVVEMGLPLVIRSGDREGVLECPPKIVFDYHPEGDHYLPGKGE